MDISSKSKKKQFLEKLFPERQIYHRSDGSVRWFIISPSMQLLGLLASCILVMWFAYTIVNFVTYFPNSGYVYVENINEAESYKKDLRQAKAKEASVLSLLEERTLSFERASSEFERRHSILRSLLDGVRNDDRTLGSLGNKGQETALVSTSIDDASARQNRHLSEVEKSDSGGVQDKVDNLEQQQLQFLDIVEQQLVERSEHLLGVLDATGIDIKELVNQENTGGPVFELPRPADMTEDDPFYIRAVQVAARLEEAKLIEQLMEAVPLATPVNAPFRLTSHFGKRLDPFTGKLVWHAGLDMTAFTGAPIVTTASGRVSYAGRKGGYGMVVEVEHGSGFKSRYGHLQSISVKRGDQLQTGQQVGTMGSSGRSTGTHLHYEISFKEKVYNPIRFLNAGKYVADNQLSEQ